MYYFFSMLLGFFIKLLDDSIDLKLNIPNFYIEFSKTMIIFISILLIQNDVIMGFIILLSLIISNYCKKFDNDFWYSYLYLIFLLCVYLKDDIIKVLLTEQKYYHILYILFLPTMIYFEETSFKEESSLYKIKIRIYTIICNSLLICALEYFNYIELLKLNYFVKFLIFINSYFLTNIIIQSTFIHNTNPIIPINTEILENTKENNK
jgi:hypothetical protein